MKNFCAVDGEAQSGAHDRVAGYRVSKVEIEVQVTVAGYTRDSYAL
jgi:hypothetical protein